jgi:hypothetical protein
VLTFFLVALDRDELRPRELLDRDDFLRDGAARPRRVLVAGMLRN